MDSSEVTEVTNLPQHIREEVFETFWKSGQRGSANILSEGQSYAYVVAAFILSDGCGQRRYLISRSTSSGPHAETKMVEFLKMKLDERMLGSGQTIVMYMNFSPCQNCSRQLCDLKRNRLNLHNVGLELVVAHLYRVTSHRKDAEIHCQGLRNVRMAGVVIRAFNCFGQWDWNTLREHILHVQRNSMHSLSSRLLQDQNLRLQLEDRVMHEGRSQVMNNDSDVRNSLAMSQRSSEDIDNISTNSGRADTSNNDDEADNDDTSTILTDATITNPTTNNFIIYNDAEINIAGIPRINTYNDNREAVPHQSRGQNHRSSVNLARSGLATWEHSKRLMFLLPFIALGLVLLGILVYALCSPLILSGLTVLFGLSTFRPREHLIPWHEAVRDVPKELVCSVLAVWIMLVDVIYAVAIVVCVWCSKLLE
ncbi:uncharacterized protein [Littorina saxatilis]|uniref:uncharacterized protein n=1 Tax=Littorina saxatilis TaxID=31220 RepID=UPI0038B64992